LRPAGYRRYEAEEENKIPSMQRTSLSFPPTADPFAETNFTCKLRHRNAPDPR
jgi:hypothetical protein